MIERDVDRLKMERCRGGHGVWVGRRRQRRTAGRRFAGTRDVGIDAGMDPDLRPVNARRPEVDANAHHVYVDDGPDDEAESHPGDLPNARRLDPFERQELHGCDVSEGHADLVHRVVDDRVALAGREWLGRARLRERKPGSAGAVGTTSVTGGAEVLTAGVAAGTAPDPGPPGESIGH